MPNNVIEMVADYGIEGEAPDLPAVSGTAVVKAWWAVHKEWMRQTDGEPWKVDQSAMTVRDYLAHFAVVAKRMKLAPDDPAAAEKVAALMLCVADDIWWEFTKSLTEVTGANWWVGDTMKRAARQLLGLDPDATAEELVDGKPAVKKKKKTLLEMMDDPTEADPPPVVPKPRRKPLIDRIKPRG